MKIPNERQFEVIDELKENILLFASAGTGKTFTVAKRIANVLTQEKAKAEEILCLTFTIKACNEMKEDIRQIVGEKGRDVAVNTIHGFCYRLIVEECKRLGGNYGELSVCDEIDQEEILKSILSSRYTYWKLERAFSALDLPMPDLTSCEVVAVDGAPVWKIGKRFVSASGELFDGAQGSISPLQVVCPVCKELHRVEKNRCVACGAEISLQLDRTDFEIYRKRTGLRNLISEIKHCREIGNFYTGNLVLDYQNAYEYLKEERKEKYEGLVSYYARYLGYAPDEEFIKAMDEFVGRLTSEYDEHLLCSNLLDFDDLILQAKRLLQKEETLSFWSHRFSYIILDEMQDTTRLEFSLLRSIFADNHVMLCGDFFQTIYGWRGSRPQEILEEYTRDFSAKIFMLSTNYRATKVLAEASFGYLKNTYPQLMGQYCPQSLEIDNKDEGEKIFCYAFDNREQEATQIYKYLLRRKEEGNVCVLARTNKYIAELSAYFERISIQREGKEVLRFFTVEENFQFFKKPLVKDMLSLFKLLINPLDRVSMERIAEKYVRQIGIKTLEFLRRQNEIGVSVSSFLDGQTYAFHDNYYQLLEGFKRGNLVVYDTETTGLDIEKDQPVQISAIRLGKEGEIVDTLDIFIEPTVPIEQGAMDTHGFTLDYIRAHGGVSLAEGLIKFSDFVKDSVLIGHNNFGYDAPLINRLLKECDLPALQIVAQYDTLPIAKQFYPTLINYKLETLCAAFEINNEDAHNALGDITATGKCLCRMIEEKILPTAMERRAILAKYLPKFEKFYDFYHSLLLRFEEGEEFFDYAVERLMLKKRYPTKTDERTLLDLKESLDVEQEDKRTFMRTYLKDAALSSSQMDLLIQKSNKIPIITVHQAKGCEFDTVILAGADDSHFPSYAAKQSGFEEEEKKIFYVAITRAKKRLIMTRALRDGGHSTDETPYFWMLPEEYVHVNRAWKNGKEEE